MRDDRNAAAFSAADRSAAARSDADQTAAARSELCFSCKAMATEFAIQINHPDGTYAGQAAWEAFRLLEEIEAELSRFLPNSDITRLNLLPPGRTMILGGHAMACLQQACAVYSATNRAFDVTAGILKDLWLPDSTWAGSLRRWARSNQMALGMEHLVISAPEGTIGKEAPVQVDLGAIGKGYAVEQLAQRLEEWGISDFLIHGGRSSVVARGCAPGQAGWPVRMQHPQRRGAVLARFELRDRALGASGIEKGRHIIDPRSKRPASGALAAWVIAPEAALADALSTAFMILTAEAIDECLAARREVGACLLCAGVAEPQWINWPAAR